MTTLAHTTNESFPNCTISTSPELADLHDGEQCTVTFVFDERAKNFYSEDITTTGGIIHGKTKLIHKNPSIWIAYFIKEGDDPATITILNSKEEETETEPGIISELPIKPELDIKPDPEIIPKLPIKPELDIKPDPAITPEPQGEEGSGTDSFNATKFPDNKFREEMKTVLKNYKTLKEIEKLDLANLHIEDLKGIELLTGLKELRIYGCSITSLDLSENVLLTSLEIQGNYIQTIDLSKLSNITTLTLNQMGLKTIDLSKLTNLTHLQISSNNLQSIDLSKNGALKTINLLDNKIKDIKLNASDKLEYLNLNKNLIEKLKLPELNALIQLDLECNNLKGISFDIIKSEPITPRFEGDPDNIEVKVPNFPNLRELNISNNQLTRIDISKHRELIFLNASSNQLKKIDLKALTQLKWLDLNSNQLSELDAKEFKVIKHLDLSHNAFVSIDCSLPIELLHLNIGYNNLLELDPITMRSLKTLIVEHNSLQTIKFPIPLEDLLNLSLNSTDIKELTLDNLPNLEKLDLRSTKLEHIDFKGNKKLTKVLIAGNKLISINLN